MRGGNDAFGWPLSLAALALKNLAGPDFVPCDTPGQPIGTGPGECTGAMANFDADAGFGGGLFEETGDDATYPGTRHTLQTINPGLAMEPAFPLMPELHGALAEQSPRRRAAPADRRARLCPQHRSPRPPFAEFGEMLFGADLHCGVYEPATVIGAWCPPTELRLGTTLSEHPVRDSEQLRRRRSMARGRSPIGWRATARSRRRSCATWS